MDTCAAADGASAATCVTKQQARNKFINVFGRFLHKTENSQILSQDMSGFEDFEASRDAERAKAAAWEAKILGNRRPLAEADTKGSCTRAQIPPLLANVPRCKMNDDDIRIA